MKTINLGVEASIIADFCRRWKINQLAVFGSAAIGQLRPDSDIDLLVTFTPDADWTMFDHYRMENELAELFNREVDLVNIRALEENPNRIYHKQILSSAKVVYAA
jgi:predicted nucleotidyltransferase